MSVLRVAALQLGYQPGESRADRVERVARLLVEAPTADLHVLPELWDVGYFAFDRYRDDAHSVPEAVARLKPSVLTVAGSVLEGDGNDLFNTIVVVSASGAVVGTYRKMHLFTYGSREGELLTPGRELGVVDTDVARLGLATCFDLRFPEQFLAMREADVDVIVVPAAWPLPRAEHWRVLAQARAIDTQTPVIACNGTGTCEGVGLAGQSMVIDARGRILSEAGGAEGWLEASIDLEDTRAWRREFPLREGAAVAT